MKPREDEVAFRAAITAAIEANQQPHARQIAANLNMPEKRAIYLCEKWIDKGWWDCGVSALSGWLTDKGKGAWGIGA